jgi:hypothetical protein
MMRIHSCVALALAMLAPSTRVLAQSGEPVELTVAAGTPLRIALDRAVTIHQAGQQVTGVLIEPVYAYDRIVMPAGTRAIGHIARLEGAHGVARAQQVATGDFTPPPLVFVQFDRLEPPAGPAREVRTVPATGAETTIKVAAPPDRDPGVAARTRDEAIREAQHTIELVTAPGKMDRLKDTAMGALPYHPNRLRARTVYIAPLATPLHLETVVAVERAHPGTLPPPDSVLVARLLTPVDSRSPKGARIEAVLTKPVFSADGRLILPEGTVLTGTVTFSRAARRFHRDGRLRFLIDNIHVPGAAPAPMLASLHAAEAGQGVAIDEEGGVRATSSPARFVAPAVAAVALTASMHSHIDYDTDGMGPEKAYGGFGSTTLGGFVGFSALGIVLAQVSRPVALGVTVYGLARTTYRAVAGRGHDVSFPAGTAIQVRLAPARPAAPR